jgi:putative transposase
MYHVMNRGDQRETIFEDEEDRRKFLATLAEACQKTDWEVHAYCLVRNPAPRCLSRNGSPFSRLRRQKCHFSITL